MTNPTPVPKRLFPRLRGLGGRKSQEAHPLLSAVAGGLIAWGTAIAGLAVVDVIVSQILLEDVRTYLARTGEMAGYVGITMRADRYGQLVRRVDVSAALGVLIAGALAFLHGIAIWRAQIARRRAVTAQAHSEDQLKRAQAFANLGTWYANLRTGSGSMSGGLRQLLGNPGDSDRPLAADLAVTHPEDRSLVETMLANLGSSGGSRTLDHRFVIGGVIKHLRCAVSRGPIR